MKIVTVNYTIKNKFVKVKMKNTIRWYDIVRGEMLEFEGGRLIFEYREDTYLVEMGEEERLKRGIDGTYRLLPKVVDSEMREQKKISNKRNVEKWFDNYLSYNNSFAEIDFVGEDNIIFHVPDKEADDFTYQLERNSFNYNIN